MSWNVQFFLMSRSPWGVHIWRIKNNAVNGFIGVREGLGIAAFVAGWCIPGGQPGVNSLAAVYYPTYLRSTGIGSGLGFGRIGAIIGPVVAGILIQRHWAARELFYAAAIPALISALTAFALRWVIREPLKAGAKPEGVLVH